MYVVYSICLYFLSIFLFTYNKNHLSKKKDQLPVKSKRFCSLYRFNKICYYKKYKNII